MHQTMSRLDKATLAVVAGYIAILIGAAVDPRHDRLYNGLELLVLWGFFIPEVVVRVVAAGRNAFRDFWLLFDALITVAAVLPIVGPGIIWLRLLRGVRILHLSRHIPTMRVISWFARWVTRTETKEVTCPERPLTVTSQ